MSEAGERRGVAFVISGPSGVGKSSLVRCILERDPNVAFSISHTTRRPRPGEVDGVDYRFVSEADFRAMIADEQFLEWAEYQGNFYGTSAEAVEQPTSRGVDLILEVEVQGAAQLRSRLPDGVPIFILPPPSLDALYSRLRARGSDDEATIAKRIEIARGEIAEAEHYRYVIVNEDLDRATAELSSIIAATRLESGRVLHLWRKRFEAG